MRNFLITLTAGIFIGGFLMFFSIEEQVTFTGMHSPDCNELKTQRTEHLKDENFFGASKVLELKTGDCVAFITKKGPKVLKFVFE